MILTGVNTEGIVDEASVEICQINEPEWLNILKPHDSPQ